MSIEEGARHKENGRRRCHRSNQDRKRSLRCLQMSVVLVSPYRPRKEEKPMKKSVYDQFQAADNSLRREPKRQNKHIPESDFFQRRSKVRKECKCGTCKTCLENARWEKIFQEKFASKTVPERSRTGCALGGNF